MTAILLEEDRRKRRKPFVYYENIDGGDSAAANQKECAKRSALEFTYLAERLFADDQS